jgi:D-alanyl-lipoteichoic acid acyltransferase DltB (MBOAT superfamily)
MTLASADSSGMPGESSQGRAVAGRERAARTALLAVQLLAVVIVVRAFELETPAFLSMIALATAGFTVNAVLPLRLRLPAFALVSVGGLLLTLGLDAGSIVLAVGAALIVLMHLPLRLGIRIALVAVAWGGLSALRSFAPSLDLPAAVWPALGTMFMFRIILYLHALRYDQVPFSGWHSIAYFFMLSSANFPVFPLVDYSTFVRGLGAGDEFETYDRGVRWIIRGLFHLLAYRLVLHGLTVGELWANDLGDVIQHVVSAFLLYLRVSGSFHLIVGLLHLFGFRLPETHHLYLLASSFGDFWRRINIYWKDATVKLVYYPAYFRLRSHGHRLAIVLATVAAFVSTWLLHSYQYFWLRGTPLITTTDVLFWTVFGLLVVATTLWETRRRPARRARVTKWSAGRALRTVSTVGAVLFLWSFWTSESIGTWVYLWSMTRFSSANDWLLLGGLITAAGVVAGFRWGRPAVVADERDTVSLARSMAVTFRRLALLGGLSLMTLPAVQRRLPLPLRTTTEFLQGIGIAKQDEFRRVRGYYSELESRSAEVEQSRWRAAVPEPTVDTEGLYEDRSDILMTGVRPRLRRSFLGKTFSTNRFGMRDRDYADAKPPNTIRIALIGPSYVMGWGVSDNETLDLQLETILDSITHRSGRHVEVLNIAMPAWSIVQEAYAIDALASRFQPDLVLLSVHPFELMFAAERVRDALMRGIEIPDAKLRALLDVAGVAPGMSSDEVRRRMRSVEERWHQRVFEWATEMAAAKGIRVAALAVALPGPPYENTFRPVIRAAVAASVPVLRCVNLYRGVALDESALSREDTHPNSWSHRRMAECAATRLQELKLLP